MNCDLQRILRSNPYAIYMFGLIAFFFLFTVLDPNNTASLQVIWLKTLGVYALFVLMTKAKWYFVIPVLVLLLIDQCIKRYHANKASLGEAVDEAANLRTNNIFLGLVIALIVVGMFHYMYLQSLEYKDQFSIVKFFFGVSSHDNQCKPFKPDYSLLDSDAPLPMPPLKAGLRLKKLRRG